MIKLNGYDVSIFSESGKTIAEVKMQLNGKTEKIYANIESDSEPYTLATHVFAFKNMLIAYDNKDIFAKLTETKGSSGSQTSFFNGDYAGQLSLMVKNDNNSPYENVLSKWMPKIERALNGILTEDKLGEPSVSGPLKTIINDKIAIIGLGGTGMRIAELLGESKVKEIHLFDADIIEQKNLLRLPINEKWVGSSKVDAAKSLMYYQDNVELHNQHAIPDTLETDYTYVILALDDNNARTSIKEFLNKNGIPFTDAGIWVDKTQDEKYNYVSRTSSEADKGIIKAEEGVYKQNIQIAEINALNAAQAVIMYKTHSGFYTEGLDGMKKRVSIISGLRMDEDV